MRRQLFVYAALSALTLSPLAINASEPSRHAATDLTTGETRCPECGAIHATPIDIEEIKAGIAQDSIISEYYRRMDNAVLAPKVFSGFRSIRPFSPQLPEMIFEMKASEYDTDSLRFAGIVTREVIDPADLEEGDEILELESVEAESEPAPEPAAMPSDPIPAWLKAAIRAERLNDDIRYLYMISHPAYIDYAAWDLPAPPRLPEEDYTYESFLESLDLPDIDTSAAILPEFEVIRRNWLHTFGAGLHFSQAYVSSNWYQGGNNYLSLLFNFNWDVSLNTVFHPNLMFDSSLSYKLAISSNPKGSLHSYSISQDQFQYNLKAGLKAWQKWFYSVTLQFKTQLFNAYPADSPDITASFLSPADFNIGLGMTYATTGRNNTLKFSASVAPISYNLKACMSDRIDVTQFNIKPGRHTHSEIGSNAEINLEWAITRNISWKSRMFLFTDYKYFLADWENTFNFAINRFLSTQFYFYPRYDSSSDFNSSKWHYWMLKEILSIGVTYTFSTKP